MNCVSNSAGRRGHTLIEVLVALSIVSAFLAGTTVTIVQVIRSHQVAEARLEAMRNGRSALTTISGEVKETARLGSDFRLVGVNGILGFDNRRIAIPARGGGESEADYRARKRDILRRGIGDGIDNDQDGGEPSLVPPPGPPWPYDDEILDGDFRDENAGLQSFVAATDRHAELEANLFERPEREGEFDLGDADVDEDVVFGRDQIEFLTFPIVPISDFVSRLVSYRIGDFEDQTNVLIRRTETELIDGRTVISEAPLAFKVLGLDLLYWDPNAAPGRQYWVETWDSGQASSFRPPRLPLPASVYVRVTLYADVMPFPVYLERVENNDTGRPIPVRTVTVDTVVNIEQTIGDAQYPRSNTL